MILDKNYKLTFKSLNFPGSERKFVAETAFLRDFRTGIHGLVTIKNDVIQFWSILDYEESFRVQLNRSLDIFDGPLTDVQVAGWGASFYIVAATAFNSVYLLSYLDQGEGLNVVEKNFDNVILCRITPDQENLIYITSTMKIVKTTIEGMQLSNDTIPLKGVPNRVTLSSDDRFIAVGDNEGCVVVHDGSTLAHIYTIDGFFGEVTDLLFLGSNNQLLVAESNGFIHLFQQSDVDVTWSNIKRYSGHSASIYCISSCNCSGGDRFASASMDGTVSVWEVNSGDCLHSFKFADEAPCSLNFSPDGNYLAVSTDEGNTYVYNMPEAGDYIENQHFVTSEELLNCFWLLEGATVFDLQLLRKALGIYNEDDDAIVFLKHKANPGQRLRDVYSQISTQMALQKEEEEEEMRMLREERETQKRLLLRKAEIEEKREDAEKHGETFEEPALDPDDLQYLEHIKHIDGASSSKGDDDNADDLAAQAGVLLSDSDDDDVPASPIPSENVDREQENEDGNAPAEADQSNVDQLWATDDENEDGQEPSEEQHTRTSEDLRRVFDEFIDTTADESMIANQLMDQTQIGDQTQLMDQTQVEEEEEPQHENEEEPQEQNDEVVENI